MILLMHLIFAQTPNKYVYTGGFFVFSHGDTLRTDRVTLFVDGKVEGLEKHPAVAKVERKKNRIVIYLKKGKTFSEKELKRYVKGKVKRIEVRSRVKSGKDSRKSIEKRKKEEKRNREKDLKRIQKREKEQKKSGKGERDVR